jgi:hypothetical protein
MISTGGQTSSVDYGAAVVGRDDHLPRLVLKRTRKWNVAAAASVQLRDVFGEEAGSLRLVLGVPS